MSSKPQEMTDDEARLITGRRAARFAAIQALYQLEQDEALTPDLVMLQFREHRLSKLGAKEDLDGFKLDNPNKAFFSKILSGTQTEQGDIDDMVTGVLPENWSMKRIDSVLRAILRAGTYEIAYVDGVPARVVINEYVEVAKNFFSGKEPGIVNAVLDQIAQAIRIEEFE